MFYEVFFKISILFLGLNSNLNVNMDMNSIKEPQSRLRKWTTVDSISANTSLDQNSSKHGIKYILTFCHFLKICRILNLGFYVKCVFSKPNSHRTFPHY